MLAAFALSPTRKPDDEDKGLPYWVVDVRTKNGTRRIVLNCVQEQGTTEAASLTERALGCTNPRYAFLVGICAGLKEKTSIGHVVVSSGVIAYGPGRLEDDGVAKQPHHYGLPYLFRHQLYDFDVRKSQWQKHFDSAKACLTDNGIRINVTEGSPSAGPGFYASGELLLARTGALQEFRARFHEKIRAGEKEAAGFAFACSERPKAIPWAVIKGVSDAREKDKDLQHDQSDRQHFASLSAATFLRLFLENGLDWPRLVDLNREQDEQPHHKFDFLTLKLGFVGDVKHSDSVHGPDAYNAVRLALNDAHSELSDLGLQVALVAKEDNGCPKDAVARVRELIKKEKVSAVIGPTNSGCALSALPLVNKLSCLMLSPAATATILTKDRRVPTQSWYFTMCNPTLRVMNPDFLFENAAATFC